MVLDLLHRHVIGSHTRLCIISYRHAKIQNAMSWKWAEPYEYYRYYSCHFMNNYNKRFKDVALKNFQDKIWQEPSRWKFDTIYDDMVDRNGQIKE
jgi:hypothetical protein